MNEIDHNMTELEIELGEKKLCDFCLKKKYFVRDVEAFYNAGRSRRIINLCFDIVLYNETSTVETGDNCYNKYYNELGFNKFIVVDWYQQTYNNILNVFKNNSSSPTKAKDLRFDTALRMAYDDNNDNNDQDQKEKEITRHYLNAIDRHKVPNVLDVERNPRIFPLRWQLCQDSRVTKVQDEPLTFRWSRSAL